MSDDVSRETPSVILDSDDVIATLPELLGDSYESLAGFHQLLTGHGVERGLIGPRESDRVWDRHIINSLAVVPYLRHCQHIIDVGSGAGLPGIVVGIMLPQAKITLIEPMERRCHWLTEVIEHLQLPNVEVTRGRSEEFFTTLQADGVTARAVAAMDKLARWTLPLLTSGGRLIALKGQRASDEVRDARPALNALGVVSVEIHQATTLPGFGSTTIVEAIKA